MEESAAGGAGPRKRRLQAAAASASAAGSVAPWHIPEELVRNILLCLPSRSVLRFRAVCKTWLQILSDPEFVADHDRLQPTLPLVSFLRPTAAAAEDCCVDAFDARSGTFRPVLRFTDKEDQDRSAAGGGGGSLRIHGSLDGLLLLSFEHRFYVCNPATHQWTRLPTPLRASFFAGFYRHEPTGEYRALFYRGNWPGNNYYIMVPDARKGKGIGLRSEEGKDGYRFRGQPYGSPVLVAGHLHWMPKQTPPAPATAEEQEEDGRGYWILAFNTTTEVPSVKPPPVIREHMSLAEVGGELAMLSSGDSVTVVEVWLLKDYKSEIWVCMHRIRLPAVQPSTFAFHESWSMFFMSEEGLVVVTPEQKLLHFDLNGTLLLESFPCDNGRLLKIAPYTFKETLVRYAFFETQDDDDGDDDEDKQAPPPFFDGL